MTQLFKIAYEMSNKNQLSVGIIAESKEKAISYLKRKVPQTQRINSTSAVGEIHAIDDEIVDWYINNSEKVKKYQQKIKNLNEDLKSYEYEMRDLQEQLDQRNQQPTVSSKDLKEALKGKKQEQQPEAEVKKIYVCPYCSFETEKKNGLNMHINKKHKGE